MTLPCNKCFKAETADVCCKKSYVFPKGNVAECNDEAILEADLRALMPDESRRKGDVGIVRHVKYLDTMSSETASPHCVIEVLHTSRTREESRPSTLQWFEVRSSDVLDKLQTYTESNTIELRCERKSHVCSRCIRKAMRKVNLVYLFVLLRRHHARLLEWHEQARAYANAARSLVNVYNCGVLRVQIKQCRECVNAWRQNTEHIIQTLLDIRSNKRTDWKQNERTYERQVHAFYDNVTTEKTFLDGKPHVNLWSAIRYSKQTHRWFIPAGTHLKVCALYLATPNCLCGKSMKVGVYTQPGVNQGREYVCCARLRKLRGCDCWVWLTDTRDVQRAAMKKQMTELAKKKQRLEEEAAAKQKAEADHAEARRLHALKLRKQNNGLKTLGGTYAFHRTKERNRQLSKCVVAWRHKNRVWREKLNTLYGLGEFSFKIYGLRCIQQWYAYVRETAVKTLKTRQNTWNIRKSDKIQDKLIHERFSRSCPVCLCREASVIAKCTIPGDDFGRPYLRCAKYKHHYANCQYWLWLGGREVKSISKPSAQPHETNSAKRRKLQQSSLCITHKSWQLGTQ